MVIELKSCLKGAKEAKGITIVIDVFRASNTIIACLAGGAKYILPIGELEKAYELKRGKPDHLLFGERGGLPPAGFDYGNSPAEATHLDLKGKKIILTTSSGSQGIVNAVNADEILIGSFANADAIVNYILAKKPKIICLLAMGEGAVRRATEDEECAKYIKAKLENEKTDFSRIKAKILRSDGATRLRKLNQQNDLEFGLKLNSYNVIPKFSRTTGEITDCKS